MPIAPATQRPAAVVNPSIWNPRKIINPAPRKPIPTTIWPTILDGSKLTDVIFFVYAKQTAVLENSIEIIVKKADPSDTSEYVLKPASFFLYSLSNPNMPPKKVAKINCKKITE